MFLTLPKEPSLRFELAREFAERFHCSPKGYPTINAKVIKQYSKDIGLSLPLAVCEWYFLVGQIGDVWTGQDHLQLPDASEFPVEILIPFWQDENKIQKIISGASIDSTFVPLMTENQGCFFMGYKVDDSGKPDPPVYCYTHELLYQLSETVSEFALQMLIIEAIYSAKYSWGDCGVSFDGRVINMIKEEFCLSAISNSRLWSFPIQFWVSDDVVWQINCDYSGEATSLGFVASTQKVFEQTIEQLRALGVKGIQL
ncbi:MAG: hypothetical protein F6J87_21975 [Spirulina sp. SIO3F2]|nr:hypothetical protein [Spirulina sp. SIO3F2]